MRSVPVGKENEDDNFVYFPHLTFLAHDTANYIYFLACVLLALESQLHEFAAFDR